MPASSSPVVRRQHKSGATATRGKNETGATATRGKNKSGATATRGKNETGAMATRGKNKSGATATRGKHEAGATTRGGKTKSVATRNLPQSHGRKDGPKGRTARRGKMAGGNNDNNGIAILKLLKTPKSYDELVTTGLILGVHVSDKSKFTVQPHQKVNQDIIAKEIGILNELYTDDDVESEIDLQALHKALLKQGLALYKIVWSGKVSNDSNDSNDSNPYAKYKKLYLQDSILNQEWFIQIYNTFWNEKITNTHDLGAVTEINNLIKDINRLWVHLTVKSNEPAIAMFMHHYLLEQITRYSRFLPANYTDALYVVENINDKNVKSIYYHCDRFVKETLETVVTMVGTTILPDVKKCVTAILESKIPGWTSNVRNVNNDRYLEYLFNLANYTYPAVLVVDPADVDENGDIKSTFATKSPHNVAFESLPEPCPL
jgi:hypothetical protein